MKKNIILPLLIAILAIVPILSSCSKENIPTSNQATQAIQTTHPTTHETETTPQTIQTTTPETSETTETATHETDPTPQPPLHPAISLGFIPQSLQHSYQEPITRAELAELSMSFVAFQYDLAPDIFWERFTRIKKLNDPDKDYDNLNNFTDTTNEAANKAYLAGIIPSKGNGIFEPSTTLTQQEAAEIIANTYKVYYGLSEQEAEQAQESEQAEQAKEAEHAFTREQSILAFFELYSNAITSRANDNVYKLLTYTEREIPLVLPPSNGEVADLLNEFIRINGFTDGVSSFYNRDGKLLMQYEWRNFADRWIRDPSIDFGDGILKVYDSMGSGWENAVIYINSNGDYLNTEPFYEGTHFNEGYAVVQPSKDGAVYLMDTSGAFVKEFMGISLHWRPGYHPYSGFLTVFLGTSNQYAVVNIHDGTVTEMPEIRENIPLHANTQIFHRNGLPYIQTANALKLMDFNGNTILHIAFGRGAGAISSATLYNHAVLCVGRDVDNASGVYFIDYNGNRVSPIIEYKEDSTSGSARGFSESFVSTVCDDKIEILYWRDGKYYIGEIE